MIVSTGPYSTRDPDRLDITRAGCDKALRARKAAPGEILAPSARLVFPTLAAMKAATSAADRDTIWTAYREAYIAEMRLSYSLRRAEWEAVLRRDRVVLVCFCGDPERCHRSVAVEILSKLGATRGEVR